MRAVLALVVALVLAAAASASDDRSAQAAQLQRALVAWDATGVRLHFSVVIELSEGGLDWDDVTPGGTDPHRVGRTAYVGTNLYTDASPPTGAMPGALTDATEVCAATARAAHRLGIPLRYIAVVGEPTRSFVADTSYSGPVVMAECAG